MGICGARGCGLQRAHCALAMKRYKECGGTGRCGERIERCQWQKKRDERVAAVKISSVRRKAARKFWAPQQDHRPLRNITRVAIVIGRRGEGTPPTEYNKRCGGTGRRGRRPLRKECKGFCGYRQGGIYPYAAAAALCGGQPPTGGRPQSFLGKIPQVFSPAYFTSSKLSAVTMDWTLVHRGAKVLARSS